MTDATITLRGILAGQPSLLDDLQIPATLDRDTMIGRICMRCNNLRPLYPDGPYFQAAIGIWSKSRLEVWEELEKTRHYDYTPIHNYDRHETEQTIQDGTYKDDTEAGHTRTTDNTGKQVSTGSTDNTGSQNGNDVTDVGGFNTAGSNAPFDKQTLERATTGHEDTQGTVDTTANEQQTAQDTETVNRKEDWQNDRELYAYGNIGVTSTQELIQQQRDIVMFNLYDVISEEFVDEFMLLIY